MYGLCCTIGHLFLPSFAPEIHPETYRTRLETVAAWYPEKYPKLVLKEKAKEENMREKNENEAFPSLPIKFAPALPLVGPEPIEVVYFDPTVEDAICEFKRVHFKRVWTREYLKVRQWSGMTPAFSCEFVRRQLEDRRWFEGNVYDKGQCANLFRQWARETMRSDKIGCLEGVAKTDFPPFDRDRIVVTLIEQAIESKQRHPIKTKAIRDVLSKMQHRCPERMRSANVVVEHDVFKDLEMRHVVERPPLISDAQFVAYLVDFEIAQKTCNETFDAVYDDDAMIMELAGYGEEGERFIKKYIGPIRVSHPTSAECQGSEPRSINPRKKVLDVAWLDQARPGFIGPPTRDFGAVPMGSDRFRIRLEEYSAEIVDQEMTEHERKETEMQERKIIREILYRHGYGNFWWRLGIYCWGD